MLRGELKDGGEEDHPKQGTQEQRGGGRGRGAPAEAPGGGWSQGAQGSNILGGFLVCLAEVGGRVAGTPAPA